MQNKRSKCEKCLKLKDFINKQLMISESAFDLAIDVNEFIKNCECEEKENEFEEYDKQC